MEPTDSLRPRPVWRRYLRRLDSEEWRTPLPAPTNDEKHDAILVLQAGPSLLTGGLSDPVWVEAQRILDDSS